MKRTEDGVLCHLYRFKSTKTNRVYILRAEEYPNHFFGVKFYLKTDENSRKKYNRLTGLNEPRQLINTCVAIMLEINNTYPDSSFGFIGANCENESKFRTKRFRVYSTLMATYFSENIFAHHKNDEQSTYLLIRKSELKKNPFLIDEINKYFSDNYTTFD